MYFAVKYQSDGYYKRSLVYKGTAHERRGEAQDDEALYHPFL